MRLKDKLITTPSREDSGGRTSNRFSFQHSWAMQKLLELAATKTDFVLVMEFFDDVIILDSSSNPKVIDFYQIKTNTKKTDRYVTTKRIISPSNQDGLSIVQKLIDNLSRFPNETQSIHLVSNKAYKVDLLDISDSIEKTTISLNEFCKEEMRQIKGNICNNCFCKSCKYTKGCLERCRKIIYFDVADLDINNYDDTVFGRFVKFLTDNNFGYESTLNSRSMYYTLMSEIVRINNNERRVNSFEELLMIKSITKSEFDSYFKTFEKNFLMENDWSDISNALRSSQENYGSMEIKKIKKQWDKYKADSLGSDLPILVVIKNDIREIIALSNFKTYREYIDYVHLQIKNKDYYKKNLYDKYYLNAVILGELYYE